MSSEGSGAPRWILPHRIHVVGNTGSGKSTLAGKLAELAGCPHVELDALHWEPDWDPAPDDLFRARVRQATAGERWVVDGNYSRVCDIFVDRLQMLVWLDYPLAVALWRLTRRSVRRTCTGASLWGSGNRETLRRQFLGRDSLYAWAIRTHRPRRERLQAFMTDPAFARITFVRLRSPRAANRWLAALPRP